MISVTIGDGDPWPEGTTVEMDHERRVIRVTVPSGPPAAPKRFVEPLTLCDCPMGPGPRCGAWACGKFGCDCPGTWCRHGIPGGYPLESA